MFKGRRAISAGKWAGCVLSQIHVPEVHVCAFSLEKTRSAMSVDKASLLSSDLRIPQAWGLAVQQHPVGFEGIKYTSRFIDQPCLVLFERDNMLAKLRGTTLGSLNELDAAVDWLDDQKAALV